MDNKQIIKEYLEAYKKEASTTSNTEKETTKKSEKKDNTPTSVKAVGLTTTGLGAFTGGAAGATSGTVIGNEITARSAGNRLSGILGKLRQLGKSPKPGLLSAVKKVSKLKGKGGAIGGALGAANGAIAGGVLGNGLYNLLKGDSFKS